MVRGKYMHVILEDMKYDPDWEQSSNSYNHLQILALIENIVLTQTKYQYPSTTVYKQECSIYSFSQNALSNKQWYQQFNNKIDVGSDIGITL